MFEYIREKLRGKKTNYELPEIDKKTFSYKQARIEYRDKTLDYKTLKRICSFIVHGQQLREIILFNNDLRADAAKQIAEALELCPDTERLEKIVIDKNPIGERGKKFLEDAAIKHRLTLEISNYETNLNHEMKQYSSLST